MSWDSCKKQVNLLSENTEHQLIKYREYTKSWSTGDYMRHQTSMGEIEGYHVDLIVYEGKKSQAWYIAFNPQENSCYKRPL